MYHRYFSVKTLLPLKSFEIDDTMFDTGKVIIFPYRRMLTDNTSVTAWIHLKFGQLNKRHSFAEILSTKSNVRSMQRSAAAAWSKQRLCRCYSVVNRAKGRAGIPLDIIRPKAGTRPVTPKPSSPKKQPNPLVVAEQKRESLQWKTEGLAKEAQVADPLEHVDSRKLLAKAASGRLPSSNMDSYADPERAPIKVLRQISLDEEPATKEQSDRKQPREEIEAMMAAKRRQPAGLAERLIKVAPVVEQPKNPHLLKVAVIGAANAGKSTLVNTIVGTDVSVVSARAHTTRDRVLAVWSHENYQVVCIGRIVGKRKHVRGS